MGAVITGTGVSIPPNVVHNTDLERIMDTSDEWIATRSGVRERRFVDPGTGASDLAVDAAAAAISDAGLMPADVDLVVTATMTPDYVAPGIAGLVQAGLGVPNVAVLDIRQQCSGFLYGLDVAETYIAAGKAETVVVVGAEVHAGFLPWSEASWRALLDPSAPAISQEDFDHNTAYRGWSVLFGDGAGAMVLQRGDGGILGAELYTDGADYELIWVPGLGFRHRPYVADATIAKHEHLPVMDGGGLYRRAVRLMPQAVEAVCEQVGVQPDDVDLVIAHQANERIVDGVRRQLGLSTTQAPSNIASYGNTTAGTLPILFHDLRQEGRVGSGTLVCFTAFGAGAHYGALLYRQP